MPVDLTCTVLSWTTIGVAVLAGAIWTGLAVVIGFMVGQAFGWIKLQDERFTDFGGRDD